MKNKKIIFKVTATYMKKNRMRTIITFLGILVMVIMMTAVFVGKDTVMEFLKRAVEADQGKWHYQVYDVDKAVADEIAALDYVEETGVSRPLGYTVFEKSGNPEWTPYLEIKGYSEELFDWMNIDLVEGRFPENENEILISERALRDGADIRVGDSIAIDTFERYIHVFYKEGEEEQVAAGAEPGTLVFGSGFHISHGETVKLPDHFPYLSDNADFEAIHRSTGLKKTVTVSGIMKAPYYEANGQGGYMALMRSGNAVAEGEKVNLVLKVDPDITVRGIEDIAKIIDEHRTEAERAEAEALGSYCVAGDGEHIPFDPQQIVQNNMLLTFAAKGSDMNFNKLMIFAQVFFIVLITAAALILIYNVFSISYTERSRYLGMLSSVGATKKQKKWSVYYEVFSLLIFALPLGIVLGLLLIKGAMALLYPHFASLIEMISANVVTGKSCEIPCELIVNPLNIIFILLFSATAVWMSAWIPALKISRIGPVESIRSTDSITGGRKKGYRTFSRLMKKGRTKQLLAAASVSRNRHTTKGIVRSITAFIVLTLVTAFTVRSITDVLKSKVQRNEFIPGEAFTDYQYVFFRAGEDYASGIRDIMDSEETEGYKELYYSMFDYNICLDDYTDEYREKLGTMIGKYFPGGAPANIILRYLEPEYASDHPEVNLLILTEGDFEKLAKKAGRDTAELEHPVLAYDTLELSTDDFRFGGEGTVKPDYSMYRLEKVLDLKEGDTFTLLDEQYVPETEALETVEIPVSFGGYVNREDAEEFGEFHGKAQWLFVSEQTAAYMGSFLPGEEQEEIGFRCMFFSVNTNDSDLLRRLAQIRDEYGDSAVTSASILDGYMSFKEAITSIVGIVAVCFTILIALICLLNLYNSVMGRRYARQRELSVLRSMGITKKQKTGMLMLENTRLLARAYVYSALITTAFVVCLHRLLDSWFGKMNFTLPLWMIVLSVLASCAGLGLFTLAGYGDSKKMQLIDEVRTEMV